MEREKAEGEATVSAAAVNVNDYAARRQWCQSQCEYRGILPHYKVIQLISAGYYQFQKKIQTQTLKLCQQPYLIRSEWRQILMMCTSKNEDKEED